VNSSSDSAADLIDRTPSREEFLNDVVNGLRAAQKHLPSKYFYDARGSELFDEICELDEYYLTRTELAILREHIAEIAEAVGPEVMLIEPGSGSSTKTEILLDHLREPAAYVPVEISRKHLLQTVAELRGRYPDLEVLPISADFTMPFALRRSRRRPKRHVVYFPGSTIGNFEHEAAQRILRQMADLCGQDGEQPGGLIIGIDLKKDPAVIEAAYNDRRGVTADFNLNILRRINRELEGTCDLSGFEHSAVYNGEAGRVEMFLISREQQTITVGGVPFHFESGEGICTEHSHKYTVDEFADLAETAGFELADSWTDAREYFAVLDFRLCGTPGSERASPPSIA